MFYVHISTRVTHDEAGRVAGFVAVQTDVTDRHVAMRREALAQRAAAWLLDARSPAAVAEGVSAALVEELEVVGANVWRVESGRGQLTHLAGQVSARAGEAGARFLTESRELSCEAGAVLGPGIEVPGVAWGTGELVHVTGLSSSDLALPRRAVALAAGIDALCAAPIVGPDGVLGVVEVASSAAHPITAQLPGILARLAEQLAAFALHDASRRAFRTIFDRNPDALLLVESDGAIQAANARAQALLGAVPEGHVDQLLEDGHALVTEALAAPGGAPSAALLHRKGRTAAGAAFSAEVSVAVTDTTTRPTAIVAVRDLTERHRMEAALTQSLREKETLLREIHHRVKNNLQIVSSLLRMQLDSMPSPEARALLEESVHRVRSMALVHQHLYGVESIVRIDLGAYARELTESLRQGMAPGMDVRVAAASVEVTIEHAVPLGLVLNELVTNAIKYGAPGTSTAGVAVAIRRDADELVLEVRDRGPGVPEGFDLKSARGLGLQIVRSLTRQIRGTLRVHNNPGAVFVLRCPLPPTDPGPVA